MKDKSKTISMFGVNSLLGEFYDEEEENAVKDVEERWSYTINDIADKLYAKERHQQPNCPYIQWISDER